MKIVTFFKKIAKLKSFAITGATKQNRTAGLRVTNPLLYQLSYSGKHKINITQFVKNNKSLKANKLPKKS